MNRVVGLYEGDSEFITFFENSLKNLKKLQKDIKKRPPSDLQIVGRFNLLRSYTLSTRRKTFTEQGDLVLETQDKERDQNVE